MTKYKPGMNKNRTIINLINMLLWQVELKKIRFEEICLLNEKNLEIIRSSINNEEIIDKN